MIFSFIRQGRVIIFLEIKWSKAHFFQNFLARQYNSVTKMPLFTIFLGVDGIVMSSNFRDMLFGNMKMENEISREQGGHDFFLDPIRGVAIFSWFHRGSRFFFKFLRKNSNPHVDKYGQPSKQVCKILIAKGQDKGIAEGSNPCLIGRFIIYLWAK